jgi:hypothetical protein
MSKFLTRILFVLTVLICVSIAQDQQEEILDPIESPANVIIGDSHAEALFFSSFSNLGAGGEPFFLSVCKVKRFQEHVAQPPKVIILAVGPQNFSSLSESRINSDFENWRTSNSQMIASLLHLEEFYSFLPKEIWVPFLIKNITRPEAIQLSHYVRPDTDWKDNAVKRATRHRVTKKDWFLKQSHNTSAIELLQKLCDEWNTQLILLETPRHDSYDTLVEATSLVLYREYLNQIASSHERTILLRDTLFSPKDNWFRDSDHLNTAGSAEIENWMIKHNYIN